MISGMFGVDKDQHAKTEAAGTPLRTSSAVGPIAKKR